MNRLVCYHGTPISGTSAVAVTALSGSRAFISHRRRDQLKIAIENCVGFSVDNGAFSAWRAGCPIIDWQPYYAWVRGLQQHKNFNWAIIPDVIDGNELDNDALIDQWPSDLRNIGVPVWHMHESFERLKRLCNRFDRVAIGSSGQYSVVCSSAWWHRMNGAMRFICDENGMPPCALHGLRMLNQAITSTIPLDSADSTSLARQVAYDSTSGIQCRHERAKSIKNRIESIVTTDRFIEPSQLELW